jgi:ABC-type spermidine/putrescine transport system permease subunit II
MQTNRSRYGTLGALWLAYGVVCLAKAAWIVVYTSTLTLMWGAIITRVADPFFWMDAFHVWLIGAVIVLVLAGIFAFVAAIGLVQNRVSGRALPLIASVLAILTGPLGIALGTYTMVAAVRPTSEETRAGLASAA